MDIITQTLFSTFLDFCLTHWRLETMTIILLIIAIYFIRKYKIELTNREIFLSFFCLFLIYTNLFLVFINGKQEKVINMYQEAVAKNIEKMDLVHEELQFSKIIMENKNSQSKLIEALEQYFQEKHKNNL